MSDLRHIEIPSAVVLRAVARPGVLLFASRDLTFIAGGAAVLIASLATDPILVIYCFLPFQAAAISSVRRCDLAKPKRSRSATSIMLCASKIWPMTSDRSARRWGFRQWICRSIIVRAANIIRTIMMKSSAC